MHRVGTLEPGDNIVLVVTASEHREAAFDAGEVPDGLPQDQRAVVEARVGPAGARWVEAEAKDDGAAARWKETRRRVASGPG